MPRAENRKKPPGQSGSLPGQGMGRTQMEAANHAMKQNAKSKKDELVEKMKQLQQKKKQDQQNP